MNAVLNIDQEKGGKVRFPKFSKKVIAIGAAAGIAMGAAGIAAAYFTATGSGTGQGTVGSSTALVVHVTTCSQTAGTGGLKPGYGQDTCTFSLNNPAANGTQQFGNATVAMKANGTGTAETAAGTVIPECSASWFAVSVTAQPSPTTLTGGATAIGGNVKLTMPATATNNQSSCEGATPGFTVSLAS